MSAGSAAWHALADLAVSISCLERGKNEYDDEEGVCVCVCVCVCVWLWTLWLRAAKAKEKAKGDAGRGRPSLSPFWSP